jgi:hypothetical protein
MVQKLKGRRSTSEPLHDLQENQLLRKDVPISLVKPRWHGLLLILKQFMTCEGHYGLIFLYHI